MMPTFNGTPMNKVRSTVSPHKIANTVNKVRHSYLYSASIHLVGMRDPITLSDHDYKAITDFISFHLNKNIASSILPQTEIFRILLDLRDTFSHESFNDVVWNRMIEGIRVSVKKYPIESLN